MIMTHGVRWALHILQSGWLDAGCNDGSIEGTPWRGGVEGVERIMLDAIRSKLSDGQIKATEHLTLTFNTWARRNSGRRVDLPPSFAERIIFITKGRVPTQDEVKAMQEKAWGKK